ncbi:MAG: 2-C-methyl-D-erythritol 2,4-cyclodiphosphate synthase [Clostridia bacterium]|nr:2-C-methyl-D-erythritol 2,4-cyclodiphosphate synthase [Clostridia bacterium]
MRIGHGYDVHRFKEGRKLILAGTTIPYEKGLDGHSDADVALHAVMDALLGAAGMPDIGNLFPDNDPAYEGISSILLTKEVLKRLKNEAWRIENIDVTVIAQAPKLASHIGTMRANLALICDLRIDQVNIKATTEEHLGFTGRGEAIACHAVCLIERAAT